MRTALSACALLVSCALACGKGAGNEETTHRDTIREVGVPGPKVTVTVPVQVLVTATPSPGDLDAKPLPSRNAKVWVAPSGLRFLAAYDDKGALARTLDLTNVVSGPVTALAFADAGTLLAFVDAGDGGESVVRIDVDAGSVMADFLTHASLENVTVRHMAVLPAEGSGFDLFVARSTGGVERFRLDLERNTHVRFGTPWPLVSSPACPVSSGRFVVPLLIDGVSYLATWGLATGAAPGVSEARVNVWTLEGPPAPPVAWENAPACTADTSTSFGVGGEFPAAPGYTPAGALFDGAQWFVRFHHDTTPLLLRYDVEGARPHSPVVLESNLGILSTSVSSRGLVALDATTLLVPEWTSDSIHRISKEGVYGGLFARDAFTNNVNAIAVRP